MSNHGNFFNFGEEHLYAENPNLLHANGVVVPYGVQMGSSSGVIPLVNVHPMPLSQPVRSYLGIQWCCVANITLQRLNKEQHKYLEEEFIKNNKPTTAYKKDLAAILNVPVEKINVS
jgi:hypothetical protein